VKKFNLVLIVISVIAILFTSNTYAASFNLSGNFYPNKYLTNKSPPYPASNPNPANNSLNIELNIILSWTGGDPDGDPVSYNVFFGTSINPPNVEVVYQPNTYNPGGLEYNTQYYWRIDTYANNGGATNGPLWTFTTKDDTPPYIPNNPSPINNSINIPRNITLSWSGGDPDDDHVTYDIYFGTNSNPLKIITDYNKTDYELGLQEYNTKYYWRIVSIDDYGYTTSGPIWSFTTLDDTPPYTPSDPIPDNQSTNVDPNIILIWSGGDPDDDPVKYNIYFGINSNPALKAENLSVTNYKPDRLDYIQRYYWRVVAIDDYGYISSSPVWSFLTRENLPPYIPNQPVPANGSTNVYIDAVLSWQGGDLDDDPVTYDVYFGTVQNHPKIESKIK